MAERVAGRVDDVPAVAADLDALAPAQPGGGLHHRVQVGQPAGEVVGEVHPLGLGHPVVLVGVAAPRAGGVGVAVLLAVQVGHGVHHELRAGLLHDLAREPVVVDVRVRDDDAGDVAERVPGAVQPGGERGQAAVGEVGAPHPAVDDGHAVAVGQHVAVDALDGVDPDRQDHARDPVHPCMRSSSVNHTRSSTRYSTEAPSTTPVMSAHLEGGDPVEGEPGAVERLGHGVLDGGAGADELDGLLHAHGVILSPRWKSR